MFSSAALVGLGAHLSRTSITYQSALGRQQQALHCERCERTFSASEGASQYVDLTPHSGFEGREYKESNWGGTTLFQCGQAPAAHCQAGADYLPNHVD